MEEKQIFTSYSWNNANVADTLDVYFQSRGLILQRDIRDVDYTESIKEFMKKIRFADFCIMLISDAYLKSKNCMFEVLEFIKDDNYKNRILPVLLDDAKIFDSLGRSTYIQYWQTKYVELEKERRKLEPLNQTDILQELKKIENIQRDISQFLSEITEMRIVKIGIDLSLNDFNLIWNRIYPVTIENSSQIMDGYYLLNVPRTIKNNVFTWWRVESKGYTQDIRDAKLFSKDEIISKFDEKDYPEWENKKFVAIPVDIVLAFDQTYIPNSYHFQNKVIEEKHRTYGNKYLILSDEEVDFYI